ncbi:hypothetical protein ACHAXA_005101 [Cyclostephanos tholiformis]|uniref:Uncharacterized protein n=1 Tax=Cyclostephanos tholiformis TaxID=382380 RepID=A0ABD3RMV7_9STRA
MFRRGDRIAEILMSENDDVVGVPLPPLDEVADLVVYDCRLHSRAIAALLDRIPKLESLTLIDGNSDEYDVCAIEDLESILANLGGLDSLVRLDIEFEHCLVNGSRLSCLRGMHRLEHLRLRGFDLSDGIANVACLGSLKSLHLCHGNANASPSNDVDESHWLSFSGMLAKLSHLHLEGFDDLSHSGLQAFFDIPSSIRTLVLRHCQKVDEDCLSIFGQSIQLTGLHIVHGPCDEATAFGSESLRHLNALSRLRSLSLFYVLKNTSDLWVLRGLTSLEYLNIAIANDGGIDYSANHWRELCRSCIVPTFPSLRRFRIFLEDCIVAARTCRYGRLDVEFASYDHEKLAFLH